MKDGFFALEKYILTSKIEVLSPSKNMAGLRGELSSGS